MIQFFRELAQQLFGSSPHVRFSGTPLGIGIDPERPEKPANIADAPWMKFDHKRELLDVQFGADVPWCHWFWLGSKPTQKQKEAAIEAAKLMFDERVGFGDIELHYSSTQAIENDTVMRVRGAARKEVELKTAEGTSPLYLANGGNSSDSRCVDFTTLPN